MTLDTARLQAILDEATEREALVGASLAIHLPGREPVALASGSADEDADRDLFPDTPLRIASVSKMFVATAAIQLARGDRLHLDRPIVEIIPDVMRPFSGASAITTRMLLDHTAGLFDYMHTEAFDAELKRRPSPRWTVARALACLDGHHGKHVLGTGLSRYSNTNYALAGAVIAKVTGEDYGVAIERGIIEPLGLKHTVVEDRQLVPSTILAHGYHVEVPGNALEDVTDIDSGYGMPDGGIASTAADLVAFARALFADKTVLDAEGLRQMLVGVVQAKDDDDDEDEDEDDDEGDEAKAEGTKVPALYGLGVEIRGADGGRVLSHGGFIDGFLVELTHREGGLTLALITNASGDDAEEAFAALSDALDRELGPGPRRPKLGHRRPRRHLTPA